MVGPILLTWRDVCLEDLAALVPEPLMTRGHDCFARGQVVARLAVEDRLAATVLGSAGWYTAQATLAAGRIKTACTCPYQGSPCKHATALVLAWLAEPASFLDLTRVAPLATASPADLRRICLELCLAAPQAAVTLLGGDPGPAAGTKAAVALASNLLAWPKVAGVPEALAERLDWISQQLFTAMASGDAEAIRAGIELAEKLLAVWVETPRVQRLTDLTANYLLGLSRSWPSGTVAIPRDDRSRLAGLLRPETRTYAGEISLLIMAADLDAVELAIADGVGLEVLGLLRSGPLPIMVQSASFESLLLLLDTYDRWGRQRDAIVLARACLRRTDEAERYVLHRRLAQYHQGLGERRQALAYMTASFRARPDVGGWEMLRKTAMAAEEWPRIKREVWPVAAGGAVELRARAALDEGDPELTRAVADALRDTDRLAVSIWTALAAFDPEQSLDLLVRGARVALGLGGHAGRRRAAGFIQAAARVCRGNHWEARWEEIRSGLRAEFGPALNWPELGSLLRSADGGSG